MQGIAVFVDTPERYTRSGELVPVITWYGYSTERALEWARAEKARNRGNVWIETVWGFDTRFLVRA